MTTYDIQTRISDNQSLIGLPVAASTSSIRITGSGSSFPITLVGRDIGNGERLYWRFHVTQAFDGAVTSLIINTVVSADPSLVPPTIIGTKTILLAGLGLGNEFDVEIPPLSEYQEVGNVYIGVYYTPAVVPTTGAISGWIPLGDSPARPRAQRANYVGPV